MRPGLPRRLAARAVTGPAAFAVAGVADWVELFSRYAWARARGREPWADPPTAAPPSGPPDAPAGSPAPRG